MKFEALTLVAAFTDKGIFIHADPRQVHELGLGKSMLAYAAIKEHCDSVVSEMVKELGEEALAELLSEMEAQQVSGIETEACSDNNSGIEL